MTVGQLIAELSTLDPGMLVIVAHDAEGNGYSELSEFGVAAWDAENRELGLIKLTESDEMMGYTEEDVLDAPAAVVIWPS